MRLSLQLISGLTSKIKKASTATEGKFLALFNQDLCSIGGEEEERKR